MISYTSKMILKLYLILWLPFVPSNSVILLRFVTWAVTYLYYCSFFLHYWHGLYETSCLPHPRTISFTPHHRLSPYEAVRSDPDVNLNFHKSHNDTPTCFLSLLTQHQGRTWESEVRFKTRTDCLCVPVCDFVRKRERESKKGGAALGSDYSSGGSDPLWVEDVCLVQRSGL